MGGRSHSAPDLSLEFFESACLAPPNCTRSGESLDQGSQSWATVDSTMDDSRFSEEMSDEVSLEQQRKEELAAMVPPPSEGSVVSENSRRTEQWVGNTLREGEEGEEEGWPNSNATITELLEPRAAEEGCSRAPRSEAESNPDLTFVGGMSWPRPQWPTLR